MRPSDLKGIVTTPIVRAPSSFATRATYWADPVPVPPPMPPVMPASLHRLTVFEPPPPHPTILIETLIDSTIFSISWSSPFFAFSCDFAALAASRSSFASASWCRAKASLRSDFIVPSHPDGDRRPDASSLGYLKVVIHSSDKNRFDTRHGAATPREGSRSHGSPWGHVDHDARVRNVECIDGIVVGRALVLLDGDEPLDPGLIAELVQADLPASEERFREDLGFVRELDREEGGHLRFGEVAHERLRRHGL